MKYSQNNLIHVTRSFSRASLTHRYMLIGPIRRQHYTHVTQSNNGISTSCIETFRYRGRKGGERQIEDVMENESSCLLDYQSSLGV